MPHSPSAAHWRDETRAFTNDAQRRFTPAMRQRIALDDLYNKALTRAAAAAHDAGAQGYTVPPACPFTLDDLTAHALDMPALLARIATAPA